MNALRLPGKIRSVLNIEPGEGKLAGLMFLYNFLLLITLYLLKPVRDSLFLVELGPQQLPIVFICTAIVAIPVSMGYSRFSNRLRLGLVTNGVTVFLVSNLVLIWWLLQSGSNFLYYVLYVWVSIYSILITSQFWLLANTLFNATQAKRIFSFLSLAAIAGAIAGGEITGLLIDSFEIDSNYLIFIAAAILLSTVFLVQTIRKEANRITEAEQSESLADEPDNESGAVFIIREILKSRHLIFIIGIIAISVITTTIVDYQFKTLASRAYGTESDLSVFMGRFYGRVSIIAFLLQLFLSPKLLEWRGVGGAVAILPSMLLLGTVGVLIWPGLIAATLLRGADQSLKHSLDRTGRELLFIPVEIDLKKRTKVFIDLFVDNGAQGLAGVLLLVLTFVVSLTVQQLSFVVAGLIVCWLILVVWVRRTYINEFRVSIEEQVNEDVNEQHDALARLSFYELVSTLKNQDEETLLRSLTKLEEQYEQEKLDPNFIAPFLAHSHPSIRRRCLRVFRTREIEGYIEPISELLQDSDANVRLEAARYVYHFYDPEKFEGNRLDILKEGLNHEDIKIRAAAFGLIAKDGGEPERELLSTELLENTLTYKGDNREELKIETARVLGKAYNPSRHHILKALLGDDSTQVVKVALMSAGHSGDRKFIHILLEYLNNKTHKSTAQKALALYGERIFGTMFDYLSDDNIQLSKRTEIPYIFYLNANPVAVDVLQIAMGQSPLPVRHEIIKALSKMKRKIELTHFNTEKLSASVEEEARRYALLRQCRDVWNQINQSPRQLKYLNKEIDISFENVFRLLGLLYSSADIYNAYKGITSGQENLVSEGIEFVENIIDWDERKVLSPILESLLNSNTNYGDYEGKIRTQKQAVQYLQNFKHSGLQDELPYWENNGRV